MTDSDNAEAEAPAAAGGRTRRLSFALLPLVAAIVVGIFLFRGLSLDPRNIPSALIDKPVPDFQLAALPDRPPGLTAGDLKGNVALVNVFASWCVACRAEHPLLMELKRRGVVALHGLNYKDRPGDALEWLGRYGDPYERIGADRDGRVGIDFGVYGVPETFIIDKNGTIVEKIIGPINETILKEKLLPLIAELDR